MTIWNETRVQQAARLWNSCPLASLPEARLGENPLERHHRMYFQVTSLVPCDDHLTKGDSGYPTTVRPIECLDRWTKRAQQDRLLGGRHSEAF